MSMKKIILSIIGILCIAAVACGYININKRFPKTKEIRTPLGEQVEFQDDVWIAVDKKELLTEEESKRIYKQLNDKLQMDRRILRVTLTLENKSSEKKETILTDLNMESRGMSNGIYSMPGIGIEGYDSVIQELEAGESRQIMFSFNVLSSDCSKKEWQKIDEKEIWLTYTAYPEKHILELE